MMARPKTKARIKAEPSSGNVFRDLGLDNPELLLAKATLIVEIHSTMKERHLTDSAAAKVLGAAPKDVDALLRGDVEDRYPIRKLASILHILNQVERAGNGRATRPENAKIKR
jgi:predicted XRE-type DNA-binding protein